MRQDLFISLGIVFFSCAAMPAGAQPAPESKPCRVLCAPSLLFESTITVENLAAGGRVSEGGAAAARQARETVFESIFALDVPTAAPRLKLSFEAIVQPFKKSTDNPFTGASADTLGQSIRDNPLEFESELNFIWLKSEQTSGWVSSHADIVDQFSPAARPNDRGVYTHKLDFELDTAVALFKRSKNTWLQHVEFETSLDYLATGRPQAGETVGDTKYVDDASPWSFSFVFVIPIIRGE